MTLEISDSLKARLEAIAARSTLSAEEIVVDALANGRSLSWYERFLDDVEKGIAAADRGEFATDEDVARVLNKYRPT
jgi:predicted transcriptional regulator